MPDHGGTQDPHLEFTAKSLPATAGRTFHARVASWGWQGRIQDQVAQNPMPPRVLRKLGDACELLEAE